MNETPKKIVDLNCCYRCPDRSLECRKNCEKDAARREKLNELRAERQRKYLLDSHKYRTMRNFEREHHKGHGRKKTVSVYEGTHLFHTSNPDIDMIEPLDRLRLAIIHRAVLDWEKLLHGKAWEGKYNYGNDTKYNFTEIRAFFNSSWCEMLVPNTDNFNPLVMLEILEKRLNKAKEESLCLQ